MPARVQVDTALEDSNLPPRRAFSQRSIRVLRHWPSDGWGNERQRPWFEVQSMKPRSTPPSELLFSVN